MTLNCINSRLIISRLLCDMLTSYKEKREKHFCVTARIFVLTYFECSKGLITSASFAATGKGIHVVSYYI